MRSQGAPQSRSWWRPKYYANMAIYYCRALQGQMFQFTDSSMTSFFAIGWFLFRCFIGFTSLQRVMESSHLPVYDSRTLPHTGFCMEICAKLLSVGSSTVEANLKNSKLYHHIGILFIENASCTSSLGQGCHNCIILHLRGALLRAMCSSPADWPGPMLVHHQDSYQTWCSFLVCTAYAWIYLETPMEASCKGMSDHVSLYKSFPRCSAKSRGILLGKKNKHNQTNAWDICNQWCLSLAFQSSTAGLVTPPGKGVKNMSSRPKCHESHLYVQWSPGKWNSTSCPRDNLARGPCTVQYMRHPLQYEYATLEMEKQMLCFWVFAIGKSLAGPRTLPQALCRKWTRPLHPGFTSECQRITAPVQLVPIWKLPKNPKTRTSDTTQQEKQACTTIWWARPLFATTTFFNTRREPLLDDALGNLWSRICGISKGVPILALTALNSRLKKHLYSLE